jgi:Xaa-Pro aminopeptidase
MKLAWVGLLYAAAAIAQPVFTDVFPPEEYAARRAKILQAIGDGVAILQGTTERPGEQPLRQANQFFYVCGVVEPRAILVIDGKARKTTLFLNPRSEVRESRMFGPGLYPGPDAARATGIDEVLPRADFAATVAGIAGRTIWTPFRPEVLGSASASDTRTLANNTKNDPWDGRISREEAFRAKLQEAAAKSEIKDLDPVLDTLRATKSPREIAILREATRIAGLGIVEAIKNAKVGMHEYELQAYAEFIFKKFGAYGPAYFALIATGPNTWYSHYHKNTATLKDGDLVQFDYAPDFKNYTSDVTRVFPANGKFTAWQREYYGIYLKMYQALLKSMRVHEKQSDIMKAAGEKMDAEIAAFSFTDERIKKAAVEFAARFKNSRPNATLGHTVGMEVHDVRFPTPTLEPGQVFTIEPALQIPDLHLGIRLEDMILVTETGIENLSAFVPVEMADLEKLMRQ